MRQDLQLQQCFAIVLQLQQLFCNCFAFAAMFCNCFAVEAMFCSCFAFAAVFCNCFAIEAIFCSCTLFCNFFNERFSRVKLARCWAGFLEISFVVQMSNQGVLLGAHTCYCHQAKYPLPSRAVTGQSVLTSIKYAEHIQLWSSFLCRKHIWSKF